MPLKFDETLIVHIKDIDEQHRQLIELINELEIQIKTGRTFYLIEKILNELKKYAIYHFATEEELFRKFNYPEADGHIIEHKQFVDTINMFDEDYLTGGESKIVLLRGIYSFLFEWIFNHIKVSDKKYARFIKDIGVE